MADTLVDVWLIAIEPHAMDDATERLARVCGINTSAAGVLAARLPSPVKRAIAEPEAQKMAMALSQFGLKAEVRALTPRTGNTAAHAAAYVPNKPAGQQAQPRAQAPAAVAPKPAPAPPPQETFGSVDSLIPLANEAPSQSTEDGMIIASGSALHRDEFQKLATHSETARDNKPTVAAAPTKPKKGASLFALIGSGLGVMVLTLLLGARAKLGVSSFLGIFTPTGLAIDGALMVGIAVMTNLIVTILRRRGEQA